MKQSLVVVVILGGGLKRDASGWRTTNFDEGDNFGSLGDRLRVVAGQILYKDFRNQNKDALVVVSGGRGQLRNAPDAPTVASILKKELMDLGVPESIILVEENSNNTFEQLIELNKMIKARGWQNLAIVSNEYHLPRIGAMIGHGPGLETLKALSVNGKIFLVSAEEKLLDNDRERWQKLIEGAYKTKGMRERISLEKQGVKQIKSGVYKF